MVDDITGEVVLHPTGFSFFFLKKKKKIVMGDNSFSFKKKVK